MLKQPDVKVLRKYAHPGFEETGYYCLLLLVYFKGYRRFSKFHPEREDHTDVVLAGTDRMEDWRC